MALCRILPSCLLLNRQEPDWKRRIKLLCMNRRVFGHFSNILRRRNRSAFSWSMILALSVRLLRRFLITSLL